MTIPESTGLNISSEFEGQTVLVVGDIMVDEHIQGTVRRLSPEAPVPIVEIQSRRFHPGGAANVAANVASLGGTALLVGIIGHDWPATQLLEQLAVHRIASEYVLRSHNRQTTTKSRVMAGAHHIVRFDEECRESVTPDEELRVIIAATRALDGAKACIISDYAKGVVTRNVCQSVISAARDARIPVIVDPKTTDFSKYRGATVITPNLGEARIAAGACDHRFLGPDSPAVPIEDCAAALVRQCGTNILITRGAEGMSLFEAGCPPVTIPAQARQVFDVTGAGDTVVAVMSLGLAAGLQLETACRLGNIAAGLVVGQLGASSVSPEVLAHATAHLLPVSVGAGPEPVR